MSALDYWVRANIDTIRNSLECLEEVKEEPKKIIEQLEALIKHAHSMLEYLERPEVVK